MRFLTTFFSWLNCKSVFAFGFHFAEILAFSKKLHGIIDTWESKWLMEVFKMSLLYFKRTVSPDFWPFFCLKESSWAPYEQAKLFSKIFQFRNFAIQKLRWHGVSVVNDYADMMSAQRGNSLFCSKAMWGICFWFEQIDCKKRANRSKKIVFFVCFWQISSFYAQARIPPVALCPFALFKEQLEQFAPEQKSNCEWFAQVAHDKRAMGAICPFSQVNSSFALSLTKKRELLKKPMSEFPTLCQRGQLLCWHCVSIVNN